MTSKMFLKTENKLCSEPW